MPLAKYIEHFQSMSRSEQISNIRAGTYSGEPGHLETLLKYTTDPKVRFEINKLLVKPNAVAKVEESKVHPVNISTQFEQAAFLINHRYEILTKPAKAQSRAVIEIGIIMLAVKDKLPHGDLEKWRDENTNLSKTWDHYCRKAAQKFIDTHGQGTALALIEGSGSNQRQVEQAEQLLMQFTGGKGPAALLHDLGIKKTEKAPPAELPEGESGEHYNAVQTWNHIGGLLNDHGLTQESWANLNHAERQSLYDIVHELDRRLKASLKN